MNSIALWTDFNEFNQLPVPKDSIITSICMSKDWGIMINTQIKINSQQDLCMFKYPFRSFPIAKPFSESILNVSCNLTMALFLSSFGEVWIWGEDVNKNNLFAIEGFYKSDVPLKVPGISKNKIISGSLGCHHAAVVCSEGFLYTWGKGASGELGSESLKSCLPTKVDNATIFKAQEVVCGKNYTGICTQGGFLYIFGAGEECKCGGISGYPYTIPMLEEFYINKIYTSLFGIVALTDLGKCFIIKGCLCITELEANKKIEYIATCTQGIVGLTKDKKVIYVWTKSLSEDWGIKIYKSDFNHINNIVSGLGDSVCFVGQNIDHFTGTLISSTNSPEASPTSSSFIERKSFEQILGSYSFDIYISRESLQKEEAAKILGHFAAKYLAKTFRRLKEFSYMQWVYRKAYASTFTPNIIGKIFQRLNVLHKSFAFKNIKKFATLNLYKRNFLAPRNLGIQILKNLFKKNFNKIISFGRTCEGTSKMREIKVSKLISTLKRFNIKILKIILKILKSTNKKLYFKVCFDRFRKIILKDSVKKNLDGFIDSKQVKKLRFFNICLIGLGKRLFSLSAKYFDRWGSFKAAQLNLKARKNQNAVLVLAVKAGKIEKRFYRIFFKALFPTRSYQQIKYGFYFISSCISTVQTKYKSYSFSSLLRQDKKYSPIVSLTKSIKNISYSRISYFFSSLKSFSESIRSKKIIKFILKLQSIQEKNKYKQVIRGYNSFKSALFAKSISLDIRNEKSFDAKPSFKSLVSPSYEEIDFEPTPKLINTERGSNVKTSPLEHYYSPFFVRRSSLENFQQELIKKYSDKINSETKSTVISKNNKIQTKAQETVRGKRKAYDESLKQRLKKKNFLSEKEKNSIIKKSFEQLNLKKDVSRTVIDINQWKRNKYLQALLYIEKSLSKIIFIRMRLPFNKLKFIKSSRSELYNTLGIKLGKNSDRIETKRSLMNGRLETSRDAIGKVTRLNSNAKPNRNVKGLTVSTSITPGNPLQDTKSATFQCESPDQSPITIIGEESFQAAACKSPATWATIKQESPQAPWKLKLYALGLSKFSKSYKKFIARKIFEVLLKFNN